VGSSSILVVLEDEISSGQAGRGVWSLGQAWAVPHSGLGGLGTLGVVAAGDTLGIQEDSNMALEGAWPVGSG
jgi:hypothetical protein